MARQRSPNYPSLDLGAAIEAAKALFKREGRTAVPPEVAVKAWGFATLSGTARSRLAGVRQYGLIENDRQGNIKLTQRGLTLAVANPSSTEYAAALQEAALAPEIFRELYENWRQASDEALRHHLIVGRKFSHDGANRLIESFRSTLSVANLDNSGYDQGMETTNGDDTSTIQDGSGDFTLPPPGGGIPRKQAPLPPTPPDAQYRWPLYEDVVAEVTFRGGQVTPGDIDLLTDYLNIVKRGRARAATAPAPSPPDDE